MKAFYIDRQTVEHTIAVQGDGDCILCRATTDVQEIFPLINCNSADIFEDIVKSYCDPPREQELSSIAVICAVAASSHHIPPAESAAIIDKYLHLPWTINK